jgi:REP element-mobilizing transposase RayT
MREIDRVLDSGKGEAWMRRAAVAHAVETALWFGNGLRYRLHAYVIMPNHVHAVLTLQEGSVLGECLKSLKAYSAREANRLVGRQGRFWQKESFDRLIRSADQLDRTIRYIEWNPVKAGLASDPKHYRFSSAFPANADRLSRHNDAL